VAGPGKTIDNGQKAGEILIVVNEDLVTPLAFSGANCLGAYTVNPGSATMLVWTGTAWAQIQH